MSMGNWAVMNVVKFVTIFVVRFCIPPGIKACSSVTAAPGKALRIFSTAGIRLPFMNVVVVFTRAFRDGVISLPRARLPSTLVKLAFMALNEPVSV